MMRTSFLLLLSLIAASEGAASPAPVKASGPLPRNFGQVDEWIYRGGEPDRDELATLAAMGVRTVIDLIDLRTRTPEVEGKLVRSLGMDFVSIPIPRATPPTDDEVARFFAVVEDPSRRPVYVHCIAGKHRTGVLVALHRVKRGMSIQDAYQEMRHYRFGPFHSAMRRDFFARAAASRPPADPREPAVDLAAAPPATAVTIEPASSMRPDGGGGSAPAPVSATTEAGVDATAQTASTRERE